MKRMNNEFIDMVICSPPYDNLRLYKGYFFDFESIAKELFRVLKKGSVIVWIVNDQVINESESGTSFKQALFFKEIGFKIHDTMIYEKDGISSMPCKTRYHQKFEYMFILVKDKLKTFNPIIDRKNIYRKSWGKSHYRDKEGNLIYRGKLDFNEYGKRWNIWKYSTGYNKTTLDKDAFEHPAIFPEKLVRDHIFSWSNKGDLIYDPFMGSGTTAKICINMNRNYIGSEISYEYCEIIKKRLKEVQLDLL